MEEVFFPPSSLCNALSKERARVSCTKLIWVDSDMTLGVGARESAPSTNDEFQFMFGLTEMSGTEFLTLPGEQLLS